MGFWIWMLLFTEMIPGIMIGFGYLFMHRPPKTVNWIFGYRTKRSMKSPEAWLFAHQYAGKIWFRTGLVLLLATAAVMAFQMGKDTDTIGSVSSVICLFQCIPMVAVIWPTERALKRNFDEDGKAYPVKR